MKKTEKKIIFSASDLQNYLACKRISWLDYKVVNNELEKPEWSNPSASILQELGNQHEENYLKYLEAEGMSLIRLGKYDSANKAIEAMKKGYEIIAQPRLQLENWMGYADILIKRKGNSHLGDYYYEVQDTKLSQETKGSTILQLSLYSEILNTVQGNVAQRIGVVKPGKPFETEEFQLAEFASYYRYIKQQFEKEYKNGFKEIYPIPVEKCAICPWWKSCRKKWHEDDHLSLVAGMQNTYVKTLNNQGIDTVEGYSKEPVSVKEKPSQGSIETFDKIHSQAKVQVKGRKEFKYFELKPDWFIKKEESSENKGLNLLPLPSRGDIYFDFEGDHFYKEGGLEYLFGYIIKDEFENENTGYTRIWALNRKDEKRAFETFMKFILAHHEKYPNFHIYHFAPYEPAALQRLASRHAVYEVEVDDLLRQQKFVDLHRVIKESLQAAVEKYSLKDLEIFANFERQMDLQKASESRRILSAALHLEFNERISEEDKLIIEEYNRDDCIATLKLHNWLEELFDKYKSEYNLARPGLKSDEVKEEIREREQRAKELEDALRLKLPEDKASDEYKGMWLLLNSISYFRREWRMSWFEFYRLKKMQYDELFKEKGAIAYLKYQITLPKKGKARNPTHRYSFDPQEISSDFHKSGTRVVDVSNENFNGSIKTLDLEGNYIDISSGSENYSRTISVISPPSINQQVLENALHSYISFVIQNGFKYHSQFDALHDLILRRKPRLKGGKSLSEYIQPDVEMEEACKKIVNELDSSIMPIQGPPGSGKTHLGGKLILDLLRQGKKVGVTAIGHKTIQNLIKKTKEHSDKFGIEIQTAHYSSREIDASEDYPILKETKKAIKAINDGCLVGGTSFFWAKDDVGQILDYLFIDEAGQMSLNQIIAAAKSAKNLVLLGDPQQLEQPQQGAHPENSDISGLDHIIGDHDTMPLDMGIFLDTSWRLPEPICEFTSKLYYENKLKSHPDTTRQELKGCKLFPETGLYLVNVNHEGNQNKSVEEVAIVEKIVKQLTQGQLTWIDRDSKSHPFTNKHIRIIAPYNIQVSALKQALPDYEIGTVDKFQGQEAPVVIYSMTSSSPEDAPRGMGFLYDPHRTNVATSRAQCLNIMVASPKLFEPECQSVEHMRYANGLCLYREMAKIVEL